MPYDVEINDAMDYDVYPLINMSTWAPQHVRYWNEAMYVRGVIDKDPIEPGGALDVTVARFRGVLDHVVVSNKYDSPLIPFDSGDRGQQAFVWVEYRHLDPYTAPVYGYTVVVTTQEVFEGNNPYKAILCLVDIPASGNITESDIFNNVETKATTPTVTLMVERFLEHEVFNSRLSALGEGLVCTYANGLEPIAGTGLALRFRSGAAFVNGKFYINENDDLEIPFSFPPTPGKSRKVLFIVDVLNSLGFIRAIEGTEADPGYETLPAVPTGSYAIAEYTVAYGDTSIDPQLIVQSLPCLPTFGEGNGSQVGSSSVFYPDVDHQVNQTGSLEKQLDESLQDSRDDHLPRFLMVTYTDLEDINSIGDIEEVAQIFARHDIIALPWINTASTALYNNLLSLISMYKQWNKHGQVYGIIDIGVTTGALSLSVAQGRVNYWKTAGAHGVLYQNAGWDTQTIRTRQNDMATFAKERDMLIIWQSTRPDDIFREYIEETHQLSGTGIIPVSLVNVYNTSEAPSTLRVFVNGIEYSRGTGTGTFSETGPTTISIDTPLSSPVAVVWNYAGHATVTGNAAHSVSIANGDDSFLIDDFVLDPANISLPTNYGYVAKDDLTYTSDRVAELRDQYNFRVICQPRINFTSIEAIAPPTYSYGDDEFYHKAYQTAPDYGIELARRMSDAAYMWAVLYGFDALGVSDQTHHSTGVIRDYTGPHLLPRGWARGGIVNVTHLAWSGFSTPANARHFRAIGQGRIEILYDDADMAFPLGYTIYNGSRVLARDVYIYDVDQTMQELNIEDAIVAIRERQSSLYNLMLVAGDGLDMDKWNGAAWVPEADDQGYLADFIDGRVRFRLNAKQNIQVDADFARVNTATGGAVHESDGLSGWGLEPDLHDGATPAGSTKMRINPTEIAGNGLEEQAYTDQGHDRKKLRVDVSDLAGLGLRTSVADPDEKLDVEWTHDHSTVPLGGTTIRPTLVRMSNQDGGEMSYQADVAAFSSFTPSNGPGIAFKGDIVARRVVNPIYKDFADAVKADKDYRLAPGSVLAIRKGQVTLANHNRHVLGVVSDTYAFCAGEGDGSPLAVGGQVLVRTSGVIKPGDLLVSGRDGTARKRNILDVLTFKKPIGQVISIPQKDIRVMMDPEKGLFTTLSRVVLDSPRVWIWVK